MLAATTLDHRPDVRDLGSQLVSGVAQMSSFMAAWLALLAEFDRREGWDADGARSCSHWLAWKCGLDGRTARAHVRVARQLEGLSQVREAFGEGRLSYSKVRSLCRVATSENEALLLDLAMNLTSTQLDRAVAAYERTLGAPLTPAGDARRRATCEVRTWYDDDGLHHTEIISPPEDGEVIERAIEYGRDRIFKDAGTPVSGPAGKLDSLVWVLRRGLVNAERPGADDESPYLVVVHVREAQAMVTDKGEVDLGDGVRLHPRTVQRLGCEGLVQGMLVGLDGRPLDLGRAVRTATSKQRRALRAMYDRCQFPGCDVGVDFCEFHHLDWWSKGGRSDLHVFRPLCRRHHHRCHEGGWRLIVRTDGALDAVPPTGGGEVVGNAPALTDAPVPATAMVGAAVAGGGRHHGAPVDDAIDAIAGRWRGEPMDRWALGVVVDHLVALGGGGGGGGGCGRGRGAAGGGGGGGGDASEAAVARVDVRLLHGSPPSPN